LRRPISKDKTVRFMPLQASRIHFSYSAHQDLLQGVELQLIEGTKVALTGPNGGGKTTLLRLLAGAIDPAQGHISGSNDIRLLEQHVQSEGNPVSGGEARISALRETLFSGARILLLDEPTNDLDDDARRWLINSLARFKGALLIVSHDPQILDLVDEIWELRHGKILRQPPGFTEYIARLDDEENRLKSDIESIKSETKKAETHARQVVQSQQKRMARGKKAGIKSNLPKKVRGAKKRQAQMTLAKVESVQDDRTAKVRERLSQAKARLRQISMFEWDRAITRPPEGKRLLRIENARMSNFDRSLSFEMTGPRRIHLKGKNGSGKSTLLRAFCGETNALKRVEGKFYLSDPFQLFDQGLSQFTSTESLWAWFQRKTLLEMSFARSLLGRLGFEQEEQQRPVSALSGGERVRLEIAFALNSKDPPTMLLLDEPTNHLDIESRRILQAFVNDFEGGLIVVSHDNAFVSSLEFDDVIDLDLYSGVQCRCG